MERMTMKINIAFVIFSVIFVMGFAGTAGIPNFQSPRYEIYTAGQPNEEGFQQVAAMGVKSVINVLPEKECLKDEEMMVVNNKMIYNKFPFNPSNVNMAMVQKFGQLLQNQEKPVLIHCSTGNHVGALWFAYRVLGEKAGLATALKEARQIGLTPEMENAIFDQVVQERENLRL
jgi:uncharacterized protein (TIGR01244 family)